MRESEGTKEEEEEVNLLILQIWYIRALNEK